MIDTFGKTINPTFLEWWLKETNWEIFKAIFSTGMGLVIPIIIILIFSLRL